MRVDTRFMTGAERDDNETPSTTTDKLKWTEALDGEIDHTSIRYTYRDI